MYTEEDQAYLETGQKLDIGEVTAEQTKKFSAIHWPIFNKDKEQNWVFKEEETYFAAYADQMIIGYAHVKILGQVLELKTLLVQKGFRRKEVGGALIATVENYARYNKCHKIILKTSEIHTEAFAFYSKHKYEFQAYLPNLYFGLDWFIFTKEL